MKKKLRVAVLSGGKSLEHEISLISGREVVKNLDSAKYEVLPIIISRDGITWQIGDKKISNFQSKLLLRGEDAFERVDHSIGRRPRTFGGLKGHLITSEKVSEQKRLQIGTMGPKVINKVDVVFIAMHGPYGEDGTIQGLLELIDVPYTGSGVLASALGIDKISSRKLFTHAGLKVPNHLIVKKNDQLKPIWHKFKPPVFVKPHNQGSSVGTTKVSKKKHLKKALNLAFSFSPLTLVEEFIDGIEITCPILGNDRPQALPLIEIVPKKEYFDYEAKYDEKLCDEIVPARIGKSLTKKAQNTALLAYQTLGCRGFARVDMITKDNDVYVLEVNTIPGLTPVSLFPKSAASIGISYSKLLDKIVMFALQK